MKIGAACTLALAALTTVGTESGTAQSHSDEHAAVERAALDYLEGFYEGDQSKIRRGVHPEVTKYGFDRARGSTEYHGSAMSFQDMLDFAASVHDSGRHPPASAPKEVHILEVLDQTAAVRVTAWWGSDYLHLAKYDGAWKIIHVLWQSPPN